MAATFAQGAAILAGLQLLGRLLPFLVNLYVARTISTDAYGRGNVQLQLALATVLFLAREPIRRACLAVSDTVVIVHLSLLSLSLGTVFAVCGVLAFQSYSSSSDVSFIVMLVAGLLELLSEPYYNALQRSRAIKERASAEAAALFAKMVMLFVCVAWWKMDVLAYAFAQVAYSTMLLLAMVYVAPFPVISTVWNPASADKHPRHFLTSIRQHAAPLRGLFLQTGLKYVLQEGERILLVTLTTTEQQAIYALVSNLASVVPRTVLQPVEEMAYTMFCAFASVRDATPRSNLLSRGICLVWHIGLLFACFGPHYAAMFLSILYGSNASSMVQYAGPVLQAYLVYLLPMGLAGFSEAYTQAMATHHTKRMRQQNMQLVFFSAVFLGFAWLTVPTHGAMGLVCSNIVHVTIRFAVHLLTIRSDKIIRVPDLLPSYPSLLCWLGSSLLLGTLGASMSDWTRFGFGSLLGLLCLVAVWTTDRSRLEKLRRDPGETRAEKID